MVLESIIPIRAAERKPIEMLPLSFLYASIGALLALWIFPSHASLALVFFTVMALIPLMVSMIGYEERKGERSLDVDITVHRKVIPFFVFMFLGLVLCYAFWAIILPYVSSANLFSLQINVIQQINAAAGGFSFSAFIMILTNNLRVLAFALLFSFIYGAGAIFILTWNASVISVAIAETTRRFVEISAKTAGSMHIAMYFQGFSLSLMRYLIHGIPEIGGYFVGGLAGGIISVAILRHRAESKLFRKAMLDAAGLTILAILILVVSAVIEITISPLVPVT